MHVAGPALAAALLAVAPGLAFAQSTSSTSIGLYGTASLLDMPTGESAADAQFSSTISHFAGITKNTLTFQITPRLSGSFRYSILKSSTYNTWDRSFDLRYQLLNEGRYRPAVAIGLRDFIGTGLYASEYIAATKSLGSNLKVTGGIGWGRLGAIGGFTNPLSSVFGASWNTRSAGFGLGGVPSYGNWFKGSAAFFGGVEWQTPIPRLTFKAEYSSDAYIRETVTNSFFTRRSPFNYGLTYTFKNNNQISAYYLYGDQFGVSGSIVLNPKNPPNRNSTGPAPVPVLTRADDTPRTTDWTAQADGAAILRGNLAILLAADGQKLDALKVSGTSAEVWFVNLRHGAVPQAIGRVARALTQILPGSVETFRIVAIKNGLPLIAVSLSRSDIEALENDPAGADEILKRAKITDPGPRPERADYAESRYSKFDWAFEPYTAVSLFDPDNPFRLDLGLRARASFEPRPGLIISGAIKKRVAGNLNTVTRVSNSVIRHVRSDYGLYDNAGDPAIEYLTAEYFFKPGRNLYGRVTVGYLEKMYGGISSELLWSRANSRLALGLELNVTQQRAFDQLFGFQPYSVVTGYASAYWDMGNGFSGQLDVGRYLAGDYGATVTIDRVFDNGWSVGAYFTLTNVSFADFGEGSFDKGLRFTIPVAWLTGRPSVKKNQIIITPITRDGGARLNVRNRLYGMVEDYKGDRLKRRWGRFWR